MSLKPCVRMVAPPALLPDFEVWRQQRAQCASCENFERIDTMMICHASGLRRGGGGNRAINSAGRLCIGEREEGKPCGPHAKLRKAAK